MVKPYNLACKFKSYFCNNYPRYVFCCDRRDIWFYHIWVITNLASPQYFKQPQTFAHEQKELDTKIVAIFVDWGVSLPIKKKNINLTKFDISIKIYLMKNYFYNENNLNNARELRKNLTPQEGKLWHLFLKNYTPKIYRQKQIGKYILDFYCAKAKLAIELDGSQHRQNEAIIYDEERERYLNELNIKVLRISNLDVDKYLEGVTIYIDSEITKRLKN